MRLAAVILNVLLLASCIVLIAEDGIPSPSKETFYFLLCTIMLITPMLTLWTLLLASSQSWLSLYFKRKAVEERKRIAELESEVDLQQPVLPNRK